MPFTDSISTITSYESFVYDGLQSYDMSMELADTIKSKAISSAEMFGKKSELYTTKIVEQQHKNPLICDNLSWTITILLMLYMIVFALSKNHLLSVAHVFFSKGDKNLKYEDLPRNFLKETNYLSVFSIFVVSAFLFVFFRITSEMQEQEEIVFFAIILAIVSLYFLVKAIIVKIVGYVSENESLKGKIYTVETIILSLYGLASGLFLVLNFFVQKQTVSVWLIIISILISMLYLFKFFKLILIFIDEKISPFFLILYLCTFEILPIWLIVDFL
jgi:hypothetical protein